MISNELVYANLKLIHESKNQSIQPENFISLNGSKLKDKGDLMNYLLKYDLIETEDQENVFYLTDIGYEVIDRGFWYDPDLDMIDETESNPKPFYSVFEDDRVKKNQKPYLRSKLLMKLVFITLIGAGSYFLSFKKDSTTKVPPQIQTEFLNTIFDSDTTR